MRAFISIKVEPTKDISELIHGLSELDCVKAAEPENLHICLRFLGDVSEQEASKIMKKMDELNGFGAFEVELRGIDAFPNRNFVRVLHIRAHSEKLIELHGALEAKLNELGFNPEPNFIAHVTLARVKRRPDKPFDIFTEKSFGSFKAERIELIKSTLAPAGPQYKTLHSVTL